MLASSKCCDLIKFKLISANFNELLGIQTTGRDLPSQKLQTNTLHCKKTIRSSMYSANRCFTHVFYAHVLRSGK